MKGGLLIINAMFLLMFVSVIIGEWGQAPAIISGIALFILLLNSIFIFIKVPSDFQRDDEETE